MKCTHSDGCTHREQCLCLLCTEGAGEDKIILTEGFAPDETPRTRGWAHGTDADTTPGTEDELCTEVLAQRASLGWIGSLMLVLGIRQKHLCRSTDFSIPLLNMLISGQEDNNGDDSIALTELSNRLTEF